MAKELAEKAKVAFLDDDFHDAVDLYSKAIDLDPNCAAFFSYRAEANIKIDNFLEAVEDANKAIKLEPTLEEAYLRKATACIELEEYKTAKSALEKGVSIASNKTIFDMLIDECDILMAEDDLVRAILSRSTPPPPLETAPDVAQRLDRRELYGKNEEAVVKILANGIPKENVHVEFDEQILSVVIDVSGEKAYHLQPKLWKIIRKKCRYEVLSTKVEIRLAKAEITDRV